MKVLLAGYSKTGTKTMHAALNQLGYEVYDFVDHFWYHEKEWKKILKEGGTAEDFKKMYENVDAAVDAPVYFFWEEIVEAFPDVKIILTLRDEDIWAESLHKQLRKIPSYKYIFSNIASPVSRRFSYFYRLYAPVCYAANYSWIFQAMQTSPILLKKRFRRHNTYVLQSAAKEKLLVYSVKEGWEPLCEFLEKEIPHIPFPWKNKGGSDLFKMAKNHPFGKQIIKEMKIFWCLVFVFIGILLSLCFRVFS